MDYPVVVEWDSLSSVAGDKASRRRSVWAYHHSRLLRCRRFPVVAEACSHCLYPIWVGVVWVIRDVGSVCRCRGLGNRGGLFVVVVESLLDVVLLLLCATGMRFVRVWMFFSW